MTSLENHLGDSLGLIKDEAVHSVTDECTDVGDHNIASAPSRRSVMATIKK
jgi:hypothetical protein